MENTVIKQVTETKFLGVLIDQHLSWKPHIDFVSKKISKSVGIIAKARFYLSSQTLMTLYYSLVYPFLTYCNVAWGPFLERPGNFSGPNSNIQIEI